MRRLLLLLLALSCVPAGAQTLDPVLLSAMAGTRTPGMAAVVIRDGKIEGEAVRGVRRSDSPVPAQTGDVWHIGSDAKPMTAALIARLVDQGRLDWTARLGDLLPDMAPKMRPEYQSVTLIQLLSHTAGLPHDTRDLRFFSAFYKDRRPLPQQRIAYIARALTEPAVAQPGAFSYSNTGFIIAAVIAERLTGYTYEELMRREVFEPLGMSSAGVGLTPSSQPSGHQDGQPASGPTDANPLFFAPAGNFYLSMRDWTAFCIDQLAGARGEGKLLSTASYKAMQTAQPGSKNGVGWGVVDTVLGQPGPALTHAGSDGNWYAVVVLFPRADSGVLVAANAGENMGGDRAGKAVVAAVLPSIAKPTIISEAVPARTAETSRSPTTKAVTRSKRAADNSVAKAKRPADRMVAKPKPARARTLAVGRCVGRSESARSECERESRVSKTRRTHASRGDTDRDDATPRPRHRPKRVE